MALLDQDHAFELAEAIVAASSADETEVSIECIEDRFVRFGHEGPTQSADRDHYDLSVRVRFHGPGGYREARSTSGTIDHASAVAALGRAQLLAKIATPRPEALPLGGPVDVEGTSPSRPTQDHTFKEKAEWIGAALAAAEKERLFASGLARTTVMSRSLVNSAGRQVHGATSRAEFALTCSDGGSDGESRGGAAASSSIACFVDQVEVERVIEDAVRSAVLSREPRPIDPGAFTVLLEPAAVSALLSMATEAGFGARSFSEGSSFMAGRLGEKLFPENVSLVDDPLHPALRGWRFDGEGAARGRTEMISAGELRAPVTDSRWAQKLGLPNTGHGVPQPSAYGPSAEHLVMEAGSSSRDELLAAVGDGLLVRQLHYVNIVEPQTLSLTGMTRGGTFRIRGGQVAEPVQNLRFTQSLVESLRQVVAVGDRSQRSGSLMGGEVVAPAIVLRDFAFTSRA
ncbi:peptidase PmbA [Planctomycetes bacterium Poly30]|uniref:Peptidase PmbA n=1 Tax=Saltatorellus ferox TaxID=2528018 RepID=A0A518ETL5_9BACT|nr:peptidase PmbA [Planctomycetes bacterium Poly30]